MRIPVFFAAVLVGLLAGCATTPPREVLARPASTLIVTGFEPQVRGVNVGTTIFQNRSWVAPAEHFDQNAEAVGIVKEVLSMPLAVVNGSEVGLAIDLGGREIKAEQQRRLEELGRKHKVDRIILLNTGSAEDWIAGTNQRLTGLGLYRREVFGMKRLQVYGVFHLQVFDCRTKQYVAADTLRGAREVYGVEWHESWAEFPRGEQVRVATQWRELLKEQTGQILTRAGLAQEAPLPERPLAQKLLFTQNRPKSWLPDGNVLPVPAGLSRARVRAAVVNGLAARGWTLVSQSDDQVVGVYRKGAKEAGVTARLSDTQIELVADDHEIRPDGTRVSVAPYARWQRNLKESVYRDLLNAEPGEAGGS